MNQVRSGSSFGIKQLNEAGKNTCKERFWQGRTWTHQGSFVNSWWHEWEGKTMRDKMTVETNGPDHEGLWLPLANEGVGEFTGLIT